MSVSFGSYEVVERVAVGSTGTVYRVRHTELDRVAAIKELSPGLREVPGFLERFRGEAEILGGLDHPNIVGVYDYVEEPDRAWIAEEWVFGASLEAILSSQGRLSAEQSLGVLRGALMGLAHAHDRGLVHRDIAPGNLLADMAGTSKLVDFGLAAPVGDAGAQGTPAFISPEAARGEPVGKSSDVYSAAAVLFMLLSGRAPFAAADPVSMLRHHIEDPAPALTGHGPDLQDLLRRSMDKDPSVRPPDAGAFLAELEEAARKRFGADWLQRASIAGLVAATVGGAGTAAGASAAGSAGQTVVIDAAAAVTGAGAAAAGGGRRGLRGLSMGAAVGLAAAAVLLLGGGAFAAIKLTGGSGAQDSKPKSLSPAAVASARAKAFAARAPSGAYRYRVVTVSSTFPDDKAGTVQTATWTFTPTCTTTSCTGTIKSSSGRAWTYTWDGTQLIVSNPPQLSMRDSASTDGPDRSFRAPTPSPRSPASEARSCPHSRPPPVRSARQQRSPAP